MPTILLAIDARTQLERLLPAALLMASQKHAMLLGIFVQDTRLLHGAALPFTHEIGASSAVCYPLTAVSMEKRMRQIAGKMRQRLSAIAERQRLPFTFQICSGSIEQVAIDSKADVVLPGWSVERSITMMRAGRSNSRASAKPVIAVIDEGFQSSAHVIEAARRLTSSIGTHQLVILSLPVSAEQSGFNAVNGSREECEATVIPVASTAELVWQVGRLRPTVMLLGRDQRVTTDMHLQKQFVRMKCPLALVQSTW